MTTPDYFIEFDTGPMLPPRADRSEEIRIRPIPIQGGVDIELPTRAAAAMLCWASHPLALALGTIAPLVPCGPHCIQYPAGPPTTWSFPA